MCVLTDPLPGCEYILFYLYVCVGMTTQMVVHSTVLLFFWASFSVNVFLFVSMRF